MASPLWEPDAKNRLIQRQLASMAGAQSSEPGAQGPGVYPQPNVGPGGGIDYAAYNRSLPTKSTEQAVGEVVQGAKAEGRDTPNITELLKLAAMVPGAMVEGAVNAAISGVTLPGDVASGKTQVMDPATGKPTEEVMGRALDLTGVVSSGSFAGAPEGALASGATRRPMPTPNPDEVAPALYSHAARVIDALPTKKATANQWIATLKNKGVKDEELEALNIPPGDQVLTKDQIKTSIDVNTPQIKEVVKGGREVTAKETDYAEMDTADRDHPVNQAVDDFADKNPDISNEDIEAYGQEMWRQWNENPAAFDQDLAKIHSVTKYSQYQLPGGENYREILVTTPTKGAGGIERYNELDKLAGMRNLTDAEQQEMVALERSLGHQSGQTTGANYQSSHWDEPNVLAHTRVNDRTIDGAKTLHVEELQSDWHQQGKKNGYQTPNNTDELPAGWTIKPATRDPAPVLEASKAYEAYRDPLWSKYGDAFRGGWKPETPAEIRQKLDELKTAADEEGKTNRNRPREPLPGSFEVYNDKGEPLWRGAAENETAAIRRANAAEYVEGDQAGDHPTNVGQRVPDAPFKKSWPDLMLKKIARRAVDEGYDAISWTDGATQADRYDLSRQVKGIIADRNPDGTFNLRAQRQGDTLYTDLASNVPADKIEQYVGKDLAEKIGKQEKPNELYSGVDLKVGGEGMKAFYDQELPRRAKKLLGAPVEQKLLDTGVSDLDAFKKEMTNKYGADWYNKMSSGDNKRYLDIEAADQTHSGEGRGASVHFVRLTPEVKARIKKGFPLYSSGLPVGADDQTGGQPAVDRTHDVPAFAGSSDDASTVYIDRHVPKTLNIKGKDVDVSKYMVIHETLEHKLMVDDGLEYDAAHKQATAAERKAVEADGIDWKSYEAHVNGMLHTIENEDMKDPPPDLYTKVYHTPEWGKQGEEIDRAVHRRHMDARKGTRFVRVDHDPFNNGSYEQ